VSRGRDPPQFTINLIAYESDYLGTADVGRLAFAMLGLTILVSLCVVDGNGSRPNIRSQSRIYP
jgi:hypothetical protein